MLRYSYVAGLVTNNFSLKYLYLMLTIDTSAPLCLFICDHSSTFFSALLGVVHASIKTYAIILEFKTHKIFLLNWRTEAVL
jgi:hypothetical protein